MEQELLKEVVSLLQQIDRRLEKIEKELMQHGAVDKVSERFPISSIDILLKIPKSHRKTLFALQQLKEATCTEVAKITGRSHNLESRYLARLYELGILNKRRVSIEGKDKKGTEVRYFLKEDYR